MMAASPENDKLCTIKVMLLKYVCLKSNKDLMLEQNA